MNVISINFHACLPEVANNLQPSSSLHFCHIMPTSSTSERARDSQSMYLENVLLCHIS